MAAVSDICVQSVLLNVKKTRKKNSNKYNNQLYHGILTNQTNLGSYIKRKLSWKHEGETMVNFMMELLKLYSHSQRN